MLPFAKSARAFVMVILFFSMATVILPPVMSAQPADKDPVVVAAPGAFSCWPSTKVTFEVLIVNTGVQPITLRSVGLQGPLDSQDTLTSVDVPSLRTRETHTASYVCDVLGLSSPWQNRSVDHGKAVSLIGELGDSLCVIPVLVDLKELAPDFQVGEPVPVAFDVSYETDGKTQVVTVQSEGIIQPTVGLPGFVRGDIHLHTWPDSGYTFSDDGMHSVSAVLGDAKGKLMDFLLFTAHAQKLGTSTAYSSYKNNISAFAGEVLASPGLEMSTRREYDCTVTGQTGTVSGSTITSWIGTADDGYYQTTLPFTFWFFGKSYTTIYISTNGFISFSSTGASSPSNTYLPNPSTPNTYIAPFWRDLNPGSGGAVYLDLNSSRAKITWYEVPIYGTSYKQTFQCLLNVDGTIQFNYMDLQNPGYPTVGVEDDQGQYGKAYGSLYSDISLYFQPSSDSHYIAHRLSSYLSNPNPEIRTGQEIIEAVKGMTGAYGGPAHPDSGSYPWRYWVKDGDGTIVTGFQLLELMTSQSQASSSVLGKWDQILINNLQSTIASKEFLVGVSTSDMHLLAGRWGLNMTYVLADRNLTSINDGIKAGKVVASADGTVTSFSAKVGFDTAKVIGEVLRVSSGQTITLAGQVDTTESILSVRLMKNGSFAATIPVNLNKTWTTSVSTTFDCYYRIEVVTTGGTTYTNPIFIDVV